MLSCRQWVEVVTDYLENSMDDDLRVDAEEHLALCCPCLLYLRQMQTTIRALGDRPLGEMVAQSQVSDPTLPFRVLKT